MVLIKNLFLAFIACIVGYITFLKVKEVLDER